MERGDSPRRQVWILATAALLAPISSLPGVAARLGGVLGWTAPLLAFPVAAWAVWQWKGLGRGGLAADLRGRWGALGSCLLAVYYLWALELAALTAGSCVDRLGRTDYGETPGWALALALAAVGAYLAGRGRGGFLRAAELFFLALAAVTGGLLLLGLSGLDGGALLPRAGEEADVPGALAAGGAALCTLAAGALALFLPRRERAAGTWPGWGWLLLLCAAAAGLCAVTAGTLGPEVTAVGPLPFFLALQGLSLPGGLQRLEALGTAAWILSDLALLGMAALAAREMAGHRRGAAAPIWLAALLGGAMLPNARLEAAQPWLLAVNGLLGGAVPTLLALTGKRREMGKNGSG